MSVKPGAFKLIGVAMILVLALSAIRLVAAQSDEAVQDDERPVLGVSVVPVEEGARVVRVLPGSPADEAGLKAGDIITAVNGKEVTAESLAGVIQDYAVGDQLSVTVRRDGESLDLNATLAARPLAEPFGRGLPMMPFRQNFGQPMLGVQLEKTDEGVRIREVVADSPAEKAGLKVGDIIQSINGQKVSEVRDVAEAIAALQPDDTVTLEVVRDGETHTVETTLERRGLPATVELLRDGVGLSFDGENWTITAMPEDSDLYKAGLREGDVLTAFNGEPFDLSVLPELLTQDDESTVTLTVERDGEPHDIDVPASALREVVGSLRFQFGGAGVAPAIPFGFGEPGGPGFGMMGGARLGVAFVTLDEQTAAEHDVDVTQGALITDVQADSPAANAGLQKGDIVTTVSGDVLDEERTLRDRLLAYEPGDTVTLDVLRGGESLKIDVTLGQFEMSGGMMPFMGQPGQGFRFFFGPDGLPFEFGPGPRGPFYDAPAPEQERSAPGQANV